jgi:hypothetical protein
MTRLCRDWRKFGGEGIWRLKRLSIYRLGKCLRNPVAVLFTCRRYIGGSAICTAPRCAVPHLHTMAVGQRV